MITFTKAAWPLAVPATAALALFGVVGTAGVASAIEGEPAASVAGDNIERPDPGTVPWFGIHKKISRDGVIVRDVVDGGPADEAGMLAGDQIVSVNGVDLDHRGAMREAMEDVEPGDTVAFVVLRDGEEFTLDITSGSFADKPGPEERPWLGAYPAGPDGDPETGLVIGYVSEGSPADVADLQVGDEVLTVNGIEVTDVRETLGRLRELSPGDTLVFVVDRDGASVTIAVVLSSQAENPKTEADREYREQLREDIREHREEKDDRGFGRRGPGRGESGRGGEDIPA